MRYIIMIYVRGPQICAKIRSLQLIFIVPQLSPTRLTDSSRQIDYTTEDSPIKLWKKMKKILLPNHYKTIWNAYVVVI